MRVVEVIPFKNFKGRLQQMKKLSKKQISNVEVFSQYLYIEIDKLDRRERNVKKSTRK